MSLEVTITIKGDKELKAKLQRLGEQITNNKPAMAKIGTELVSYYKNRAWNSRGGVYGAKWPPLSAVTLFAKGAASKSTVFESKSHANFAGHLLSRRLQSGGGASIYGAQPLMDTGNMRNSFTSKADRNSVTISNSAPYFKYHQSAAPRKRLPRRQMLGINSGVKSIIQEVIQADVAKKIAAMK